jgi:FkbM family methyltransferase
MSVLKASIKTGLGRLGYTLQRLPSPASDPQFALQVDFEYVLDHYLASRDDPRPFFFVQVGAMDGVFEDPLHARIRAGGWHGILIEPQPFHFGRLVENYAGLNGLTFVNAAISEQAGPKGMYAIKGADGQPIESLGGLMTFREDRLRKSLQGKLGDRYPGSSVGSVEVACTTFAEVLADTSYLDLLQIDVEGFDLEILKLFAFDRLAPPIVRFEHRLLSADELDQAVRLLARHGYRMVREEYDMTAYSLPSSRRSASR